MSVTKSDLVSIIVKKSKLKKEEAYEFISCLTSSIIDMLHDGYDVKIPGFGGFLLRNKNERIGRNPKTKEEYIISKRRVVTFKASSLLKSAMREKELSLKKIWRVIYNVRFRITF